MYNMKHHESTHKIRCGGYKEENKLSTKFFTNGNIVDVVNEKVFAGSVLVVDGIIKEVGENLVAPADAEVVDLGGKTMMPGIFNCHTHVCIPPLAAPTYDENDCQVTMMALGYLKEFLASGVTFIRDVGGRNFIDIDIRDAVKAGKVEGPDMQVSGKCICMTGGHGWMIGREANGVDDCKAAAREQLKAGADWIKVMGTGGVMTKGVEPGSPQLDEDELHAAIAEGHKVGAKSCTHSQGMTGIKNALRAGVDSIEHGFFMDDWCFDWMKEHNVFYVPTLAAMHWIYVNGVKAGIAPYVVRKCESTIDAHNATFEKAYKAGVKIALGTDAGTPFNPHSKTCYEMILMASHGMSTWDALKAGTINAAELCEVKDVLGSIEVGKKAHFAVFAENPLDNLETVMDCKMTVKDGEVVYKA